MAGEHAAPGPIRLVLRVCETRIREARTRMTTQPTSVPEVYVLWHPRCVLGDALAPRMHAWLRPGGGLGPQVTYRSPSAPEAPPGGLPPPLPGEPRDLAVSQGRTRPANLQIVLPLIDAHMVRVPPLPA